MVIKDVNVFFKLDMKYPKKTDLFNFMTSSSKNCNSLRKLPKSRLVMKYDLNLTPVKLYKSVDSASKDIKTCANPPLGANLRRHKAYCYNGFIYKYYEEGKTYK